MQQLTDEIVQQLRSQFPALQRTVGDRPAMFFDGPAGTQVPNRVIEAISDYLRTHNANHGGAFATSHESDALLAEAHQAFADFVGADDADEIIFGPNMTTLTFALSRALAKTWRPGDEIMVTRLDHDANVSPWVLAAKDAGATVQYIDINTNDCTLNLSDFFDKLNSKTKLVAIGAASNSVGTINQFEDICQSARIHGALSFVDAVHFAPHMQIDVADNECDFLACSVYKFFGPHIGVLWGKRQLLEELSAYKVRPASNKIPDKWMTGTQNHECIAGSLAAVEYLADIGRTLQNDDSLGRREALVDAFVGINQYEQSLLKRLLEGLATNPAVTVYGITDIDRIDERLPTISIHHAHHSPEALARRLGEKGAFVWHGHYYALELSEALGFEPEGMVRIGLVHYNTPDEVDRLLDLLSN